MNQLRCIADHEKCENGVDFGRYFACLCVPADARGERVLVFGEISAYVSEIAFEDPFEFLLNFLVLFG